MFVSTLDHKNLIGLKIFLQCLYWQNDQIIQEAQYKLIYYIIMIIIIPLKLYVLKQKISQRWYKI
jgi:hypothetical protein